MTEQSTQISKNLLDRALQVIPSASQTYSKSYRYFTKPLFADYGINGFLYTVDGGKYHDFDMGLGSMILGYKDMADCVEGYSNFSIPHPVEIELAEKLVELIPSAEMVKFFKNGSDATEIAVRLARAYTEKDIVLAGSYHGFHDWYVGLIERNKGIPKAVQELTKQFKNVEELKYFLEQYKDNIACVIVEPDMENINEISSIIRENNIILIFDEVLTGFRNHIKGLQYILKITPDISCFGKCMANGLPLSAVVGRRALMQLMDDGGVFASSTFGGETLALSVALETIRELEEKGAYLWKIGIEWKTTIEKLIVNKGLTDVAEVKGLPSRCGLVFINNEYQTLYKQELLKRKILVNRLNNFCLAHTYEQIDYYIKCADEVLDIIKKAKEENNIGRYLENGTTRDMFRR